MLASEGETLGSESCVENLLNLWSALSLRRRVIVVAATLGMFMAIIGLARYAQTPSMSLLFSGLDAQSAGEIVSALDQRNIAYEVRGDAIYVPESTRDSLRMVLAGEGLPAVGEGGYELLDGLTGFGTTSQMFDAAYWRAKEGELARTILALPEIRSVRVHLARTPNALFQPEQLPTASVTVTTRSGGLTGAQAKAIRHLIAGAVSGLRADDVAVIDSVVGLIPSENDDASPLVGADARAAEIRRNLEHLLDARVGPGKSVVEVAVDVVTDREQVTQTTFDPQGRVIISSESQESSGNSNGTSGSVTVASNLPNGDANGGSQNTSQNSEKQEKVNYEVSSTRTEILKVPGSVRKISVAVLVDGEPVTAADGTVSVQPRSEAELAALQELVSSAAGLDTARGDVLTIKSMPFQPTLAEGASADAGFLSHFGVIDLMSAIQLAVLALVALVLGLFVVRPVLTGTRRAAALPPPEARLALPGLEGSDGFNGGAGGMALTGEIDDGDGFDLLGGGEDSEGSASDPVARLRRLIEERQAESVEILRGWMEPDEEHV
jgi:flagellar M-ring protein FliF